MLPHDHAPCETMQHCKFPPISSPMAQIPTPAPYPPGRSPCGRVGRRGRLGGRCAPGRGRVRPWTLARKRWGDTSLRAVDRATALSGQIRWGPFTRGHLALTPMAAVTPPHPLFNLPGTAITRPLHIGESRKTGRGGHSRFGGGEGAGTCGGGGGEGAGTCGGGGGAGCRTIVRGGSG